MRWRVLIIVLASVVLVADSKKRRQGSRALDKKQSASTPKSNTKPADKQGSRYGGPTGVNGGIKSATVEAGVVAQSTGEGGFVIGPNYNKSNTKSNEARSSAKQPATGQQGTGITGAEPQYPKPSEMPLFPGPGIFLPQMTLGSSMFQDYVRHFGPPGSNIPQAPPHGSFWDQLAQGFQSPFMSQFSPGMFTGHNTPGSFMSPGFDFFGHRNVGPNYGYQSPGTYTPPSSDPETSMIGSTGNGHVNAGIGTYESGAGTYGTGTGMYGSPPGIGAYGNPSGMPYYGTARELNQAPDTSRFIGVPPTDHKGYEHMRQRESLRRQARKRASQLSRNQEHSRPFANKDS